MACGLEAMSVRWMASQKSKPYFGGLQQKKRVMLLLLLLGAHSLPGFYHGDAQPTLTPAQPRSASPLGPDPPVLSPTDVSFQAVDPGNSTARTEVPTTAQGRHVFNADEISWNSSWDEIPPSHAHGALSDFNFIHPNANPSETGSAPVPDTSNHSASHRPHITEFQMLHPKQLALHEQAQCQDDSSFRGHVNADKTIEYSCADWVGLMCDEETARRCKVGLHRLSAVRAACPDTCQLCKGTLSAGPTFKYGGKWFKFALPHRGESVPLLSWAEGDQQYVLKGSTFGTSWTGDDTTQWFGHFEVARVMGGFDIILLEVSKNDGRRQSFQRLRASGGLGPETMKVTFGNSVPMASDKQSQDGVDVTLHATDATFGDRNAEQLTVGVGGFHFQVSSGAASKYTSAYDQRKYSHLNFQLKQMPAGAHGLLAELAGQQPLSEETRSFLVPTKRRYKRTGASASWRVMWNATAQSLYLDHEDESAPDEADGASQCPVDLPR